MGKNLTQTILGANLNGAQLPKVRMAIKNGAKPAEVKAMVGKMTAPKLAPLKQDVTHFTTVKPKVGPKPAIGVKPKVKFH